MKSLLQRVEPPLSYARAELRNAMALSASPPASIEAAFNAVAAARAFLEIHRQPVYASYDPRRTLNPVLDASDKRRIVKTDAVTECVGDATQVAECVDLILNNSVLESDAILAVDLFEEEQVPQLALELDGPGRFRDPLSIGSSLEIPFETLEVRWTAATRGGRIDKTASGLRLRLRGIRVVPESKAGLEPYLEPLSSTEHRLSQALKLARAEPNSGPELKREFESVIRDIESLLDASEAGEKGPEPANLCALVEDLAAEAQPELKRRGIAVETVCDRNVPPIAMRRERMSALQRHACSYAREVLAAGGALFFLVDFDAHNRVARMAISLDGLAIPAPQDEYIASMRRIVTELHGGTFHFEAAGNTANISLTLPDPVGRCIDNWIPGWEGFTDRSRQVLRLLKSGGPGLPEDVLLEGVLEEELEKWLLPRLEEPAAVNLAHELAAANASLSGSSMERLEKALGQVRKRKPRKEIARPPYAAELIWAFGANERGRRVLGLALNEEETLRLCSALLRRPVDTVESLRLIAAAIGAQKSQKTPFT